MKKIIITIITLILIGIMMMLIYFNFIQTEKVAVLTYHDVVISIEDDPNTTVNISKEKFENQIKWLKKHGYKSITMDEFYAWKKGKKKLPRKSVLITFDDGWKNYLKIALPILEKYDMASSVFVVFKYSENCTERNEDIYLNFEDIKEISTNHKLAQILSHSYNLHEKDRADSNDYNLYDEDIKKVSSIHPGIKYYAYPFGHRNDNYIKALKDNEYKLAFTFGPYDFATKDNNDYEIPRMGLFESTKDWKFKLKMLLKI